jgi:hypothetical protein
MVSNSRMHSILVHSRASFSSGRLVHARSLAGPSFPSPIGRVHSPHDEGYMESVLNEIFIRHAREGRHMKPISDTFKLVEEEHSSIDHAVRARIWKIVFGNAPMPLQEDVPVENYMGSLDKYLPKGRRISEDEMQAIFRRMHTKT